MNNSNFKDILLSLEQKDLAPVYVFDGEEPFYIDELVRRFEHDVIPDEEKDFNQITLYGRDTGWQEVVSAARRYPMFGDKLLVLLREADQLTGLNELAGYIENPTPSTILVIEHRFKKLDNRGKLSKVVAKSNAVRFYSEKIKEGRVPEWIVQYGQNTGVEIGGQEAELLAAYLGNDLQKIANEIDKMKLHEGTNAQISLDLIAENIGISKEYNAFDFPDRLFSGNMEKVTLMLNYFLANPKACPMPLMIGACYNYLKGVNLCYSTRENFQQDRKLGIWSKHRLAAKKFSEKQIHRCILILEEFSHKTVGIDNLNKDGALLKELVAKIRIELAH